MIKTQDHNEFENFVCSFSLHSFNIKKRGWNRINKSGRYYDGALQFGFECWIESKRIQRDHAIG